MKLILLHVSSLDGISNQGGNEDHHEWTSQEDQNNFLKMRDNARLIVMGSRTYEGAKHQMKHVDGRLRIVMTSRPQDFENEKIPGKLEFTNENPTELIKRLERLGITEGIHVGGATTNTLFFKQKLISEVWQTVEPKILGIGEKSLAVEKLDINLELISSEQLNARGTLLLRYKVLN